MLYIQYSTVGVTIAAVLFIHLFLDKLLDQLCYHSEEIPLEGIATVFTTNKRLIRL